MKKGRVLYKYFCANHTFRIRHEIYTSVEKAINSYLYRNFKWNRVCCTIPRFRKRFTLWSLKHKQNVKNLDNQRIFASNSKTVVTRKIVFFFEHILKSALLFNFNLLVQTWPQFCKLKKKKSLKGRERLRQN